MVKPYGFMPKNDFKIILVSFSVNNILFKFKVHRDTSYLQYNIFERDTEISLEDLFESASLKESSK